MRQNFLDAIIASPADNQPRLVYADWLEEQGETIRADYIRMECSDTDRMIFIEAPEWGMVADPLEPYWERGFISRLKGPISALIEHGPAICREHPVESVEVTDKKPYITIAGREWCWLFHKEDGPVANNERHAIPTTLKPGVTIQLKNFPMRGNEIITFGSEEEALRWLNVFTLDTIKKLSKVF